MPPKRMNPTCTNLKKKTPSPVAGGRGRRGRGRGGRGRCRVKEVPSLDPAQLPSLEPAQLPSLDPAQLPGLDPAELPSLDPAVVVEDAEDATHSPSASPQYSPTHSRAGSVDSQASLASQASSVKSKKDKKANKLSDDEEELMVAFLEENEMIWNKKVTHYRRPDMKNAAWQKQAETMSKEVSHLQGWFKGMRDNFARLEKLPKSGSGQRTFTERELWTLEKMHFLKKITYHTPEPVSSVQDTIHAHSGDLSAAEAECAMIGAEAEEEEEEGCRKAQQVGKKRKGAKSSEDALMATLQKRLQESGQQMLQLQQAMRPQTPEEVFGTYVKGVLVNLPRKKFKKARTAISRILEVAMEDSDEEEPPSVTPSSFSRAGSSQPRCAPTFSSSPKAVEGWQPAPELWKNTRPPPGSTWQSQDCGYMDRYQSGMTNQMAPPPPVPPQFAQQQQHPLQRHQYPQQRHQYPFYQQQQHHHSKKGSHQVSTSCDRDLEDISHISGLSALLETSHTSGQVTPMDVDTSTLSSAGEKQ